MDKAQTFRTSLHISKNKGIRGGANMYAKANYFWNGNLFGAGAIRKSRQATYRYIKIKWHTLPPITNRWKTSWEPKFLCFALKTGSFNA